MNLWSVHIRKQYGFDPREILPASSSQQGDENWGVWFGQKTVFPIGQQATANVKESSWNFSDSKREREWPWQKASLSSFSVSLTVPILLIPTKTLLYCACYSVNYKIDSNLRSCNLSNFFFFIKTKILRFAC